jgi:membrane peptidoglycan carboxypeptidase
MGWWKAAMGLAGLVGVAVAWVAHEQHHLPERVETVTAEAPAIRMDTLPDAWLDDLLAVEDPAFYAHGGVDLWTHGAGMTTLTQALVKRLWPWDGPGVAAKLVQTVRAVAVVEPVVPKEAQLELMLRLAYLGTLDGRPVVGFEDGARTWYGKPLAALSRDEFRGLVAMLIAPNALDPLRHADALEARLERVSRLCARECEPEGHRDVWLEGCAVSRGGT